MIYDDQKRIPPDGRFYFLAPGDHYDMATRVATRAQQTQLPIDRVEKVPGP